MIVTWMIIASLVGFLALAAAGALERAARALRLPTRWAWVASLIFSISWPVWLIVRGVVFRSPGSGRIVSAVFAPIIVQVRGAAGLALIDKMTSFGARISSTLIAVWVLISLVLLARVVGGVWTMHRRRARWAARELDGMRILVAPYTGPAVIGVRRPMIVLPEWALSLDSELRAIVLRHEREHLNANDTALRLLAALLPVLMPWNVALWRQAGRLALAIEVDCDARVLSASVSRDRYGRLLLAIAERQTTTILAPALSEPTSHLERRVTAMQYSLPRRPALAAASQLFFAVVLAGLACSAPSPGAPQETPAQHALRVERAMKAVGPDVRDSNWSYGRYKSVADGHGVVVFYTTGHAIPYNTNPAPEYPDAMQRARIDGSVTVQFVVDTAGRVEMSSLKVLNTTNELFTRAVMDVLPSTRFQPAQIEGRNVRELVTFPYSFAIEH